MQRIRENNYDLLRIISAIAVIAIHVSATYMSAVTQDGLFGDYYVKNIGATCLYNVLPRFAVPCFLMLSGAFVLDDNRNAEFKYFYQKSFRRLGIPAMLFSLLYVLYNLCIIFMGIIFKTKELSELLYPFRLLALGALFYHMWYVFVLIGVYLMVPVLIHLKNDIGEKNFEKVAWIFLIVVCMGAWTSTHLFNWDLSYSFCFLGYIMVGYVLRKRFANQKSNIKGICLIVLGIMMEVIIVYLRYQQAFMRIEDASLKYSLVGPFNPIILCASVLIFAGFSMLIINRSFEKISALTFLVYLIHAGIWEIGAKIVRKVFGVNGDNRIIIPVCIIIVFILSLIFAWAYKKIWSVIEQKFSRIVR